MSNEINQEMMLSVTLNGNQLTGIEISTNKPAPRRIGANYYINTHEPYTQHGLILRSERSDISIPIYDVKICNIEDFKSNQDCTFVKGGNNYYRVLPLVERETIYALYYTQRKSLTELSQKLINAYHYYMRIGGCALMITLTYRCDGKNEYLMPQCDSFSANYKIIRKYDWPSFWKTFKRKLTANSIPKIDAYAIVFERDYNGASFHAHIFCFFAVPVSVDEVNEIVHDSWKKGSCNVVMGNDEKLFQYIYPSIPKDNAAFFRDIIVRCSYSGAGEKEAVKEMEKYISYRRDQGLNTDRLIKVSHKVFSLLFFPANCKSCSSSNLDNFGLVKIKTSAEAVDKMSVEGSIQWSQQKIYSRLTGQPVKNIKRVSSTMEDKYIHVFADSVRKK